MSGNCALPKWANIPRALNERDQWVCWREVPNQNGELTKPPFNRSTGLMASPTDPGTWSSFSVAKEAVLSGQFPGLGIVMTESDPFTGVDFDECRNPETGRIDPKIMEAVKSLNTYVEISPSGAGLRLFVRGALPEGGRKRGNVELYADSHCLTVTGNLLRDSPRTVNRRQRALTNLHERIFGREGMNGRGEALPKKRVRKAFSKKGQRLAEGDYTGYPSASEAESALVFCAFNAGWSDDETADLLRKARGLSGEKEKDDSYFPRTVAKARKAWEEVPQKGSPRGLVCLADIKLKPVSWLWPNRFPIGKLSLVIGDPDLGKSLLMLDMAARVSTGSAWPDSKRKIKRGAVIVLSAEDDVEDTITPRLMAAGADLSRIHILLSCFSLVEDRDQLVPLR